MFFEELKKMGQMHVPGTQELLDDAEKTLDLIMQHAGVERRLRGITPEEMLRRLSLEDRLRGLSAAERARLRDLLLKQEER